LLIPSLDMVTMPMPSRQRCTHVDADGGRCQLLAGHLDRHAAAADGAFLTWDGYDVHRWGKLDPPDWLIRLPWAPGFPPANSA
jgi:hypothetical protein